MIKKIWKKLLIVLGVIGIVSVAVGALVIPAPDQMQKVNVIGERHIATFDCGGVQVTEFSSDTDYNERFIDLQGERPNPPTKDGCEWISSSRATHFDTSDGFIHKGEYAKKVENGKDRVFYVGSDGVFHNQIEAEFLEKYTLQ